ncbi:UNVERIFIED_ORG: hypothetical protein GCAPEGMB_00214 [Vibrio phage V07]
MFNQVESKICEFKTRIEANEEPTIVWPELAEYIETLLKFAGVTIGWGDFNEMIIEHISSWEDVSWEYTEARYQPNNIELVKSILLPFAVFKNY